MGWALKDFLKALVDSDEICGILFQQKEVSAFLEHSNQVFQASWSPHCVETFASVSADGTLRLWDIRTPQQSIACYHHDSEVLCCDWDKIDSGIIATGTSSGKIFEWDVRKNDGSSFILSGHEYAIRKEHSEFVFGLDFNPKTRNEVCDCAFGIHYCAFIIIGHKILGIIYN
ncbi:peroxisomal targeting signal 2 receptor [Caerostris extrusa]|uniref:Peroxin-7 n=1 Tax=Caerostris extrusa TaxID=172846 RepID=A0AAV4NUC7_CAEEX|nr:peroxisomal targeting signal 2 receptor [Caerostris extrusa]